MGLRGLWPWLKSNERYRGLLVEDLQQFAGKHLHIGIDLMAVIHFSSSVSSPLSPSISQLRQATFVLLAIEHIVGILRDLFPQVALIVSLICDNRSIVWSTKREEKVRREEGIILNLRKLEKLKKMFEKSNFRRYKARFRQRWRKFSRRAACFRDVKHIVDALGAVNKPDGVTVEVEQVGVDKIEADSRLSQFDIAVSNDGDVVLFQQMRLALNTEKGDEGADLPEPKLLLRLDSLLPPHIRGRIISAVFGAAPDHQQPQQDNIVQEARRTLATSSGSTSDVENTSGSSSDVVDENKSVDGIRCVSVGELRVKLFSYFTPEGKQPPDEKA